ncbi:Metallo-dependent hydrolase [Favolaschia claudopus]|uniref:Metallo-dependent hydrolase n=1 Tax=Favolaschia claudopus TaxID=2862362 RepID=A0AAV9Z9T0_9AGAR
MSSTISGPAAAALDSLTPSQLEFIEMLPKAELHAHLNGSIPISALQELAQEFATSDSGLTSDAIEEGIAKLQNGVVLDEIHDFFNLFPAIYALTSNPSNLRRATRAMNRRQYVQAILDEVERYPPSKTNLIVSLDRKMTGDVIRECVEIAIGLKVEGKRVVGIDLCGDPTAGDMGLLAEYLAQAKNSGLGITLHIAETPANTAAETIQLLSYAPDRLGHATFLNDEAKSIVLDKKMCIEICLTSNLLCKTVSSLDAHHIRYYLENDHPIVICTDDTLPFRTSLVGEYALLLAASPLGLGLTQVEVKRVAEMGMGATFQSRLNSSE